MDKERLVAAGALLWGITVGAGLAWAWSYSLSPGTVGTAPADWPEQSRTARQGGRFTLVMAAHPHCPCSAASLEELARIMARSQNKLGASVFFFRPENQPEGWERGRLWDKAAAIPGVEVLADREGLEARRFGAETSGQTLLYNENGRLVFRGGITSARGHSGNNAGREAILSLLDGRVPGQPESPVFGCALQSEHYGGKVP